MEMVSFYRDISWDTTWYSYPTISEMDVPENGGIRYTHENCHLNRIMIINHEMLGYIFIKPIYIMEIGSWENLISSNGLFLGDLMEFNLEIWRRHAMRWYNHRKKIARTNHRRWGYTDWMKWTDNHEDYECVWMTMNDYDWLWMILNDYAWFRITMNVSEWLWMSANDYEWLWMIVNDYEWVWIIMNDCEWFSEVGLSKHGMFRQFLWELHDKQRDGWMLTAGLLIVWGSHHATVGDDMILGGTPNAQATRLFWCRVDMIL